MSSTAVLLADACMLGAAASIALAFRKLPSAPPEDLVDERAWDEHRRDLRGRSAVFRLAEPLVVAFSTIMPRLHGPAGMRALSDRVLQAGSPYGMTASEYTGFALTVALLAGASTACLFTLLTGSPALLATGVIGVGVYPLMLARLRDRAFLRRVRINRQLPFALDLMGLTVGAGATLTEALEVLATRSAPGPLRDEFSLALREIRMGIPRRVAFERLARRTGSDDVLVFVNAVGQGEELGTPVQDTLAIQAAQNRYRRTARAERLASLIPLRVIVPTLLMMVGCMLLAFAPVIVRAVEQGLF